MKSTFTASPIFFTFLAFCMLLAANCPLLIEKCFSQSITWQRTYDGPTHWDDAGNKSCNADNSNFYVCGVSIAQPSGYRFIWVLKINAYGDTIWTRLLGDSLHGGPSANAIVESGDGGCVLTGFWYQAFTIKLNTSGEVVWQKNYGGSNIQCYDIKKTIDGGYIFCGTATNVHFDGYVGKVDSKGNIQWQRTYPSGEIKVFNDMQLAYDGGYIISGWNQNSFYDTTSGLLTKIDSSGNQIWEKNFRLEGSTSFYSLTKSNNCYLVAGQTGYNNPLNVFFARISIKGDLLFTKLFPTTRNEQIPKILSVNPNKYIISLLRDSSIGFYPNPIILIADSVGNVLVEKKYYSTYGSHFQAMLSVSNGDYLFTGGAENNYEQNDDVYIVRTDSLLNSPPISITNHSNNIPKFLRLYPNYPNPFNPTTSIKFDILQTSKVELIIYDVQGRKITQLINQNLNVGSYKIVWDADLLPSGVYFIRLLVNENLSLYNKSILIH